MHGGLFHVLVTVFVGIGTCVRQVYTDSRPTFVDDPFNQFYGRVSREFDLAEVEAKAATNASGSSLLQGSDHPELTIGLVTSPSIAKKYAYASTDNWKRYASLQGYRIEVSNGGEDACGKDLYSKLRSAAKDKAPIWAKICLLQRLLLEAPAGKANEPSKASYVMVIDADTFVQHPHFNLMDGLVNSLLSKHTEASGLMFDDRIGPHDYPGCWGQGGGTGGVCRPNTFLMVFRRGDISKRFVKRWLDDALGGCADKARGHPPTQRVLWSCTRPEMEKQDKGFLYVHNGIDSLYTLNIHNNKPPLVHFQTMKGGDLSLVRDAIGRVPMMMQLDQ